MSVVDCIKTYENKKRTLACAYPQHQSEFKVSDDS